MMKKINYLILSFLFFVSCTKQELTEKEFAISNGNPLIKESVTFESVSSIDLGNTGASEISAFDPLTNKLFVVKNDVTPGRIEVVNLSDPSNPAVIGNILISPFGIAVNSVSVNNGMLAAAIESNPKQNPGRIVVFRTTDYTVLANKEAGALPDMVTFSPDGKFIISANEGEPNAAYTIDPIGSITIIEVEQNFAVTTLDFSGFAGQEAELKEKGLRKFGPNASFAQDMEPEYVAVSANSKTAWVSLQENNAIASIDLSSKTIEKIFPMGFKDYNLAFNAMDPSNADGIIGNFNPWPVKGMYLPDALAVMPQNGVPFVYSANEGDARDYDGFKEEFNLAQKPASILDASAFPNRDQLRLPTNLGNLKLTNSLGDTDGDGDYDELYSFGSRSFSVWNGQTGQLVYDSRNELDIQAVASNIYADGRSDDKSTEPEGITIGRVGNKSLLFLAMERVDAVAVYDVTNPVKPFFLQMLLTGDAPEGILFVEAAKSPTGKSLLIVSNEGDGTVKTYTTESLVQ